MFLIVILCLLQIKDGIGGKTATKVGLAGITQLSSSSSGSDSTAQQYDVLSIDRNRANHSQENALKKLKYNLFQVQGYDKAIRPVKNNTDVVLVHIDFTYMQVLDLNEKEQTLKSLLRYRLYWKDHYLTWDPQKYDGITHIWLPSSALWIPDIVCYQETGSRDYSPRIPYVVVNHNGTVRYLEPTAYETTCHIKIDNFPFDRQTCNFTFTSWTFPTTKVDLVSKRTTAEVLKDIPLYFANTGEWMLEDIKITKISQNYLAVLPDTAKANKLSEKEQEIMTRQFYRMGSNLTVKETVPLRVSDSHWSDVEFKLLFRRNFSLYIQSMVFPAILLTTISLLGFYLPPDSGERIGLQITILLTFMVFILTVGDMFPASTGPYLGIYFVLCMGLLGINIIMTVLVLYVHHIPVSSVMETDPSTGVSYTNITVLPLWVKLSLVLCGLYDSLSKFTIPEGKLPNKSLAQENAPLFGSLRKKWKKFIRSCLPKTEKRNETIQSISYQTSQTTRDSNIENGVSAAKNGYAESCNPGAETENVFRQRQIRRSTPFETENTMPFASGCAGCNQENDNISSAKKTSETENRFAAILIEETQSNSSTENNLKNISRDVSKISCQASWQSSELKNKQVEEIMQEKWRAVARKLDVVCMFAYIGCVVVFHLGILLAIVFSV